jgi:hypothetical protein
MKMKKGDLQVFLRRRERSGGDSEGVGAFKISKTLKLCKLILDNFVFLDSLN